MRKIFVFIVGLFIAGTVFAVGENVPTSKSYVDSAIAQKQDTIPANAGAAQVLTNTGTPGDVGTKNIYDSTGTYATQTDALITAGDFNAAVQNAIDSEFECIQTDANGECLLVQLSGITEVPSGYTQLEYLESTGTQYIDTGVASTNNIGVVVKYAVMGMPTRVFGTVGPYYYLGVNNDGQYGLYGNWSDSIALSSNNVVLGQPYIYNINYYNSGTAEFVGLQRTVLAKHIFTSKIKMMHLFTVKHGDIVYQSHPRIYYMKMTDGTTLVRDFVPARRDSDGVLGMYDTVTGTFFTNAGTGEFIAGPVVPLYLPQN